MTVVLAAVFVATLFSVIAAILLYSNPASLASTLRYAGPLIAGLAGLLLILAGRISAGGFVLSGAVAWWGAARSSARAKPSPGRRSKVRTAALEMELDHDSGEMAGTVLAGPHEGLYLRELGLEQLLELLETIQADRQSVELLETYLDRRFAGWRENTEPRDRPGQGSAPRTGTMTEQEAYEILGLDPGAAAADIRKAHRRLMQRVHPDLGGSSFLAARINEAKDVLLKHHN